MRKATFLVFVSIVSILLLPSFIQQVKSVENTLFSDNFESYTVGTFPSSGGWELVWNGMGDQYQVITDAFYVSPTKSLQLWGSPNDWSAVVQKHFSSTSRFLGYEVSVMVSAVGGGGPGRSDYVGFFCKEAYIWGKHYAAILFNHDTMSILTDDNNVVGTWTPGTWYNVKVLLYRNTNTYSVWIDGQLKGTNFHTPNTDTNLIDAMQLQSDHPGVKDYFDDVRVFEQPNVTLNVNVFDEGGFSPASALGAVRLADVPVTIYAINGTLIDSGITNSTGSASFNLPIDTYNVTYGGKMITPYDSGVWWAINSRIVDVNSDPTNVDVYAVRIIFHHYSGGNNYELNYIDLNTITPNHEDFITVVPGQLINAEFSWWELETANVPVWYVSAFGSWNPTSAIGNLASGTASPSSHNLHTIPLTFNAPTILGVYEVRLIGVEDYDWPNSYYTSFHYQPTLGRDTCDDLISKNQTGPYGIGIINVTGQPSQLSVSISPISSSTTLGSSVVFTSTVIGGTPPYSYQWYLNDCSVSGATSSDWTFTLQPIGNHNVYLNVTDSLGNTAKSNQAQVTVAPQLAISISPMSASVHVGESVTFTSSVSGGYPPYGYQWYLDGNPIPSATLNVWTFTPTSTGVNYVYLKVTDSNNDANQSDIARISAYSTPVGGYSISFGDPNTQRPMTIGLAATIAVAGAFIAIRRKIGRRKS